MKKVHIENIINKNLNKCPKCGQDLVKRTNNHGNFIGCTNYPRCKYTRKINFSIIREKGLLERVRFL